MLFLEWRNCFLSLKEGHFLKLLWSLCLNIVRLFGCFITDVPTTKINRLHERAFRIVYDDDVSTFDQLLALEKPFCIHHQNVQRLLIENCKALHGISGNSLKEFLVKRESTISLRYKTELVIPSVNSVLKGKNSLRYFGSVIWNSQPTEIREDPSILSSVTKIKQWKPIACPCTICKSYIGRVGYIKVSDY